jgi:DNA-binding response OmpR family regulator
MKRVLVVEDDVDLSVITTFNLVKQGYQVDQAYTCKQARQLLDKNKYDVILLDVALPDMQGTELCAAIRSECDCPIIFMSCLSDSDVIITALKNGGDDYMVKPIDYDVLNVRIDAIMRRMQKPEPEPEVQEIKEEGMRYFRSFQVDTRYHRIIRGEEEMDLSSIEYALLAYMMDHPDVLLLYQELYRQVWGNESFGDIRTVMVHISNLRKKLDPDRRGVIGTVRGAGYIFSDV